ncbi:MAG: hypothetical protein ACRDT4_07060 [Micromonosporaceae bacterium]
MSADRPDRRRGDARWYALLAVAAVLAGLLVGFGLQCTDGMVHHGALAEPAHHHAMAAAPGAAVEDDDGMGGMAQACLTAVVAVGFAMLLLVAAVGAPAAVRGARPTVVVRLRQRPRRRLTLAQLCLSRT